MQCPALHRGLRSEGYALIREIMDDRDTLPLNFDVWEKNAESERAAARREELP